MSRITPPRRSETPLVEWQTLGISAISYGGVGLLLWFSGALGVGLTLFALPVFIALHSSLQHEVLHGHPFRSQRLSDALVFPALGLFIPYERFRDTHLQHHFDPNLTDPYDDPESNYLDPEVWATLSRPARAVYRFNNILLGRMIVGPLIALHAFYTQDLRAMLRGDGGIIRAYLLHFAGLVPVLLAVGASALPLWAYAFSAYMGLSLLKIRTFLEHRAHEKVPGRTVIIESRGPLSLLFLNNNLHSVHHAHPGVAWYRLPGFYAAQRGQFVLRNEAYVYRSYWDVFRAFFLQPKDPVAHPLRGPAELHTPHSVSPVILAETHEAAHIPLGVARSHNPNSV